MQVVFYITATGEIDFVDQYDDDIDPLLIDADTPVGDSWLAVDADAGEDASADLDYVLSGVVTPRPVVADDLTLDAVADGTTVLTIAASMPIGTVVNFDGADTTLASIENVEFKTALAGPFEVIVTPPFPHIPAVFEITALRP